MNERKTAAISVGKIALLAIALSLVGCASTPHPDQAPRELDPTSQKIQTYLEKRDRTLKLWTTLFWLSAAADTATSYAGFNQGLHEGNPLFRSNARVLVPVSKILIGGAALHFARVGQQDRAIWIYKIATGTQTVTSVWNTIQIAK